MPRTLLAAACGAGLAVCGTMMRWLPHNPLADPFVLGGSTDRVVLSGVAATRPFSA